tara:strand:- start:699 stop:1298 length:600 start_codon:yes stop_codon:yes gene_type:complete
MVFKGFYHSINQIFFLKNMKKAILVAFLVFIVFSSSTINNFAEIMFKDNFQNPEKWKYISDNVMGGISTGEVHYQENVATLTGNVSTENNGGFIQIRMNLDKINLDKAKSIKLIAKGNKQKYFIHLRTTGTFLPWQYYQAEFIVEENFKEFILPIKDFKKSGSLMVKKVNPKKITSIGLVAYGRDHEVKLTIKKIEFIN